jgi:hypothetical protein
MKLATFVLVGIMALGSFVTLQASQPASTSEVAIGFNGGSTWTSITPTTMGVSTGICVWYFPVVGDLNLGSLFETDQYGTPLVNREHSYLIWVSDFGAEALPPTTFDDNPLFLFLAPAGRATIYFKSDPEHRDWSDLTNRSTWGTPVAVFMREASVVRSNDGLTTDTFIFSAKLVSSMTFRLNGRQFNLKDLIPNGMTCFETGYQGSSWESGSCVAMGNGQPGH